jgi:hypothetical protein
MSMPVTTFQCDACDFSRWDSIAWGYRYYLLRGTKVPMRVNAGWCHSCNDLVAMEVLPTDQGEAELKSLVDAMQGEIDKHSAALAPKKRWWQRSPTKSARQSQLGYEIESARERLGAVDVFA